MAYQPKVINNSFKRQQTKEPIEFWFTGESPDARNTFTARVAKADGTYCGDYPVIISGSHFIVETSNFSDYPVGAYRLEVWESYLSNGKTVKGIYPEPDSFVTFTINENVTDATGEKVKTFDLDQIIADAANLAGKDWQVDSTTTLPAGSQASVTKTYDGKVNHLSFKIPKGDTGDVPQLHIGTVTQLAPGSTPTATLSGSGTNYSLNLGLVTGQQGIKGDKGDKGDKGEIGDSYYNFNAAESDSLYSLFLKSYISKNSLDTSGKFNFGFNNVASTTDVATGITRGTFKNSNSNTGIYWFYDTSFITPSKQYIFSLKVRGKNYEITKYGEEANAYTNKIVTDEYAWTTLNFMFQAKKNIVIYGNFTDNDGFLDIDRNSLKIIDCTEIAVTNLATSTSVSIPVNTSYPTWSVANVTNTLTPGHYFISYTADANKTRVRVYDGGSNDYTETYGGFNQNSNIVYYEFNVPYNASNAKVGIYSSSYNVAATTTVNISKLIIGKMSDKVGGG